MSKSNENVNEELLPEAWKRVLQENFTTFRDHLRVREVVPHMYSALAISDLQKQEIGACPTDFSKIDYIVNTVVRRGTKATLLAFKRALKATDQSHLIPYLPADGPFNKPPGSDVTSAALSSNDGDSASESMDVSESHQDTQDPNLRMASFATPSQPSSNLLLQQQAPDSTTSHDISVYPMHNVVQQPTPGREYDGGLERYRRIPGKQALCVIFGLFAARRAADGDASLPGYIKDIRDLEQQFHKLGYNVEKWKNLTKSEFLGKIVYVQEKLRNGDYDRFVFIVLSHGQQDGILTCEDNQGHTVEQIPQVSGSPVRGTITFRYIVEEFLPDKVPSLRGQPKLFLFQCCRGTQIVQGSANMSSPAFSLNDCIFGVECDILMSFSSVEDTQAFVDLHGSWYIQSFLRALNKCNPRETEMKHILSLVNDYVSRKQHIRHELPENAPDRRYIQTSIEYSTLRRLFYLHDPH